MNPLHDGRHVFPQLDVGKSIIGKAESLDEGGWEEVGRAEILFDQGEDSESLPFTVRQAWLAELAEIRSFALDITLLRFWYRCFENLCVGPIIGRAFSDAYLRN